MGLPVFVRKKLKSRRVPRCPLCDVKCPSWQQFSGHLTLHCGVRVNSLDCTVCRHRFKNGWDPWLHLIDLLNLGLLETHIIHHASMHALLGDEEIELI